MLGVLKSFWVTDVESFWFNFEKKKSNGYRLKFTKIQTENQKSKVLVKLKNSSQVFWNLDRKCFQAVLEQNQFW